MHQGHEQTRRFNLNIEDNLRCVEKAEHIWRLILSASQDLCEFRAKCGSCESSSGDVGKWMLFVDWNGGRRTGSITWTRMRWIWYNSTWVHACLRNVPWVFSVWYRTLLTCALSTFRSDRDSYVRIDLSYVPAALQYNFNKYPSNIAANYYPYEYGKINDFDLRNLLKACRFNFTLPI